MAAAVALEAVTIEIPAGRMVGFIGPDGVGKSSLLSIVAGARQIQSGSVFVLDGDMAGCGASRRGLPSHRLYAARIGQESLRGPQRPREHRVFWPPVRTIPFRARPENRRTAREHRAGAVFRSAGEETVGRHAAKARALLLSHPRSGPPDSRRADHRRRSALAPAILGADRPHAFAPTRA